MSELVINQIIVTANSEMQKARDRLEIEESGREVASLQGKISGYKELISDMAAEFGLTQILIENSGDAPMRIKELDDKTLELLALDVRVLMEDPRWLAVLARIEIDVAEMKSHLLFEAEKSRDLDLCQGKYKGETIYKGPFYQIEQEAKRREDERAKKAQNPDLFEDGSSA